MNVKIFSVALFSILAASFAQENYSQWSRYRNITVNTTGSGANVASAVANFPVLIRLSGAHADVFSQAASGGADIRFTDSTGAVRFKHQRERWDSANQVAEFWVLVPSISGNALTSLRMYWGKSSVVDSSSSVAVFNTANNFTAVWHMNEASGDISDATNNAFVGVNNGTTTATGSVGPARSFNGTTSNYIRIDRSGRDDGGANTNNARAALLDSVLTTNFTFSLWFNANSWGTAVPKLICRGSSTIKYSFQGTNPGLLFNQNATTSGPKIATDPAPGWHLVHGTYVGGNVNFYFDGAVAGTRTGGTRATDCSPYELMIGARNTSTAYPPTTVSEPFNGLIDEVRIENVARDSNWIKLEYATQMPGATTVSLGSTQGTSSVPGAPTGVAGVAGNAQVAVSWTAPASNGGAAITAYTVTSTPGGLTCATTGGTSCTVTGLTNGTGYTFMVTATNSAGTGPASSPSASVTPTAPVGVPGSPTAVTGTAGNAQVAVSWTAPSSNGGSAITGYTVTSNPDGKTCTTTGALTCTVNTLTNGSAYTFTVTATNSAGIGAASTPSTPVTPVGAPGAPLNVTGAAGNTQVVVSWTAPSNGGSAITGYNVVASPGGAICASTGALTCTVTGLTNGTAYTFTATATNALGTSATSAPSAAMTPVSAPSAPRGVTGVAGDGQVVVSWVAPSSNGGLTITAYTVTTVQDTSKHCSTTGALTCTVTGLASGTAYTFTVKATNAAGTSVASTASASVTTGIMGFSARNGFGIHVTGSSVMFQLPSTASGAQVSVMDVWGRTVWSQSIGSGVEEISWNGRTEHGSRVRGIYLMRLTGNSASTLLAESKVMLLP